MYLVNIKDLIVKTEFYGLNPELLFTGDDASDSRVISIPKIWEEKGYTDPSTISIDARYEDKLLIVDGRHRTKLAYLIRVERIPITVHKSSVGAVERIIKLNST